MRVQLLFLVVIEAIDHRPRDGSGSDESTRDGIGDVVVTAWSMVD